MTDFYNRVHLLSILLSINTGIGKRQSFRIICVLFLIRFFPSTAAIAFTGKGFRNKVEKLLSSPVQQFGFFFFSSQCIVCSCHLLSKNLINSKHLETLLVYIVREYGSMWNGWWISLAIKNWVNDAYCCTITPNYTN